MKEKDPTQDVTNPIRLNRTTKTHGRCPLEHLYITTLLQAAVHVLLCFSDYDKTNGQRCRALRDGRAVNSLGTQIKPGVQHANKINDETVVAVQCTATGIHTSERNRRTVDVMCHKCQKVTKKYRN